MRLLVAVGCVAALPAVGAAWGQAAGGERPAGETVRGVVWTPPSQTQAALRTLDAMKRRGVTGVRLTRPVFDDAVLAGADTLGLHLYVDLPVAYASASRLQAAAPALADTLDRLLAAADRHPSLRAVGLAPLADTSVPATCDVVSRLAERVRTRGGARLRTYSVTPFRPEADRCPGAVDLVLLDVRDTGDPVARWQAWRAATDRPVGVGALGTWMRPPSERSGSGGGLQVPHSPEWQARALERGLARFTDTTRTVPPAVFVYRWSDRPDDGAREAPLARNYGLFDAAGEPRPVARVVTGFYTGRQRVFAFPSGQAPPAEWSWLIVLGWIVIGVVAAAFAQSPPVRRTAARYFTAHGFYRDAVREGRETLPEINAVLLIVVAAALGVVASAALRAVDPLPVTTLVLEALPSAIGTTVGGWIQEPGLVGIGVGVGSLVLLGGWTLALALASREWGGLRVDQVLMLVVWACWPAVPAMIIALVSAAQAPGTAAGVAGLLVLAGGVASMWVTVRVLRDYTAVSKVPGGIATALAALSPPAVVLAAATLFTLRFDVSLPFLWHLMTRT